MQYRVICYYYWYTKLQTCGKNFVDAHCPGVVHLFSRMIGPPVTAPAGR